MCSLISEVSEAELNRILIDTIAPRSLPVATLRSRFAQQGTRRPSRLGMVGRCGLCIMVTLAIATVAWWLAGLVLPSADMIRSNNAPEGNEQSDIASGEQRGWGRTEPCPSCPSLFGKLKQTRWGTTQQHVQLQVRGEPKSGTSFMFEWGINSLASTCQFLKKLYGKGTCSLTWNRDENKFVKPHKMSGKASVVDMKIITMNFKPNSHRWPLAVSQPCACDGVDRVVVKISHLYKHRLPVKQTCPWQHIDNIAGEGDGCSYVKGRLVQNYTDVLDCLIGSPCRIEDNRLQMLVIRDPRAVVVSSYFWRLTHHNQDAPIRTNESLEQYVRRMLPTICQNVLLRYALLLEKMPEITQVFEYSDATGNRFEWHQRWLTFVGLNMPESVVREASGNGSRPQRVFMEKGIDKHPGGNHATSGRSFKDEVSDELAAEMDRVARVWLPPDLVEKFGIPLE